MNILDVLPIDPVLKGVANLFCIILLKDNIMEIYVCYLFPFIKKNKVSS